MPVIAGDIDMFIFLSYRKQEGDALSLCVRAYMYVYVGKWILAM